MFGLKKLWTPVIRNKYSIFESNTNTRYFSQLCGLSDYCLLICLIIDLRFRKIGKIHPLNAELGTGSTIRVNASLTQRQKTDEWRGVGNFLITTRCRMTRQKYVGNSRHLKWTACSFIYAFWTPKNFWSWVDRTL